ncbi:hypothetical protein DICPUDRAFT_148069 [Dictyostelium purpureum]|uniref:SMP-LTD domain-containing protein n=1 Tax=Dictyostelium purpureum TaxID=5786 RepID=F0ZA57_DICPU|nr:uncharacterized protein DICPUDRAFT_148069 [Dictyostelium purpureum]EGC39141.1 hypothetical protein DICPUDRAFT_148069 [Dictyostelium purpureum]|eukprot:XP_003284287.1 hypothetical protein DICPUDRAFT_148069 [Dictyostelium purpureum]
MFIIGFLCGIIFTTSILLYIFFQLLSKKVDPKDKPTSREKQKINNSSNSSTSPIITDVTTQKIQEILELGDIRPTSIETCKWINFITARILSDINNSSQFSQKIYSILNNIFDDTSKPDFLGKLSFSDIVFGTTTPEIGIVKLVTPENSAFSILEFDLIYSGDASVTATADLWLNWPQKHIACLPVKTKLSLKHFSGKFVLYIPNTPNPTCALYLKNSPQISLRMITKMGHETVLKEPGKIGQFIQTQIIKQVNQRLVSPNFISFNLLQFLYNTPLKVNHNIHQITPPPVISPTTNPNSNVNKTSTNTNTSPSSNNSSTNNGNSNSSPLLNSTNGGSPPLQSSLKSKDSSVKKRTSSSKGVTYSLPISPNTSK